MELDKRVVSTSSVTGASGHSKDQILKKCIRKGDIICYTKTENINMFEKNTSQERKTDGTATRSDLDSDTINSGESLFKTFTFEQSNKDEETEKCIAFWKSVMERNLTPIKCTIIENNKKTTPTTENKTEQISEKEEQEKKKVCDENIAEQIRQEYREMWISALREIQKKKLHEIKLIGKSRCKMCESISSSVDQYDGCKIDKRAIKKEIKELNNWKSVSTRKLKQSFNKANSKTNSTCTTKSPIVSTEKIIQSNLPIITRKQSSSTSADRKNLKNLAPDTITYKYTNIIEDKKEKGVYSEWRSKAEGIDCRCGQPDCDCNVDQATVAIEEADLSPVDDDCQNNNPSLESQSTPILSSSEQRNVPEKKYLSIMTPSMPKSSVFREKSLVKRLQGRPSVQISNRIEHFEGSSEDIATVPIEEYPSPKKGSKELPLPSLNPSMSKVGKSISLLLKNCNCSNESCDCFKIESVHKEPSRVADWVVPQVKKAPKRVDSLEIIKRTMSKTISSVRVIYPPDDFDDNSTNNGGSIDEDFER